MKNFKQLFIIITFLIFAISAKAQNQKNIVKFNPIGLLAGESALAYERAITSKLSLQLSGGFLSGKAEGASLTNMDTYEKQRKGYIIIPEIRFHPYGNGLNGLFLAGYGRFRKANNNLMDTGTDQDFSQKTIVNTIGGGATLGYQWVSKKGFSFDIFIGGGYKKRTTTRTYSNTSFNEPSSDPAYTLLGDELFIQKYLDFKLVDKNGWNPRFGIHFGYAF